MKDGYTEVQDLAESIFREILQVVCDPSRTDADKVDTVQRLVKTTFPQRKREITARYASARSSRQKGAVTCQSR